MKKNPHVISRMGAWGLAKRHLLRMGRSIKNIFVSVLTPIILLLVFGPAMGSVTTISPEAGLPATIPYLQFFIPGIIALTLFYSALFSASSLVQEDKITRFDEIIQMTPNSKTTVIIGYFTGGFIHSIGEVLLIILVTLFISFNQAAFSIFLLYNLLATVLSIGTFLFVGIIVAKVTNWEHYTLILSVLSLPIIYLSTVFTPAYSFSEAEAIVNLNPVSVLLRGYRISMIPVDSSQLLWDVILLLGYFLVAFLLCLWVFGRDPQVKRTFSKNASVLHTKLDATEATYIATITRIGKETLGEIYRLLLEGKQSEAFSLFRGHITDEEINRLFESLALSKDVPNSSPKA